MEAENVLNSALRRVRLLKSYKCVMELYSYENSVQRARQLYLYRAPGDIRIEQLGPFRKGAVVVIRTNGKIRAHAGGLLSFIKVDLNKSSSVLRGITGDSAMESDWISILGEAKRLKPFVVRRASKAVRINSMAGSEVTATLERQPFDRIRLVIRADGPVLLIERFKNRKLINRTLWKKIQLNPLTKDADFDL